MPVEPAVLRRARKLVGDSNLKLDELSTCVSQDPVLTMELLRISNAMFFVKDRPAITGVRTACVRLGSEQVTQIIESVMLRREIDNKPVAEEFEKLRALGRRISIVARIISTSVRKELAIEAQTIGLLTSIGYMLACQYLGKKYLDLNKQGNRAKLVYRLAQDHNFDIRARQLAYLRRQGIPEVLLCALDREAQVKSQDRTVLRFVVESAVELVEAWDTGKWDRYDPNRQLPNQSSIRLLQMTPSQYEILYETCAEYLHRVGNGLALEEEMSAGDNSSQEAEIEEALVEQLVAEEEIEEAAVKAPIEDFKEEYEEDNFDEEPTAYSDPIEPAITRDTPTFNEEPIPDRGSYLFESINTDNTPVYIIADEDSDDQPTRMHTQRAQQLVASFSHVLTEAQTTEDLLTTTLKLLTNDNLFSRAALMVLAPDRRSAIIHVGVGPGIKNGQRIPLRDPLSPLATCLTKIRSFNAKGVRDHAAPLGISSYAVSPLTVKHDTPVVLYADCGENGSMTMESRRIFRFVIGLINQSLQTLPGSLPKATSA